LTSHISSIPANKLDMAATDHESLNELLKWSIENSNSTQSTNTPGDPSRGLNSKALAELLGGPSDADRMRGAMAAITAPFDQVDLGNKLTAWDNLEQLIEQIDNANNLSPLGLWSPLIQQLDSSEAEMRRMAAWCVSTAVQNNVKCQEHFLETGAMARVVQMATEDESVAVRKKAVSALSSEVRNFQLGLDELVKNLPAKVWSSRSSVDAGDMEAVDELIQRLRDNAART